MLCLPCLFPPIVAVLSLEIFRLHMDGLKFSGMQYSESIPCNSDVHVVKVCGNIIPCVCVVCCVPCFSSVVTRHAQHMDLAVWNTVNLKFLPGMLTVFVDVVSPLGVVREIDPEDAGGSINMEGC